MPQMRLMMMASALMLAACQTSQSAAPAAGPTEERGAFTLADTDWMLIEIIEPGQERGREVAPQAITMTLTAGGEARFKLDCNRGTGRWERTGTGASGTIRFSPAAVTMMLCPGGSTGEQVGRDLAGVTDYAIDDGRLTLRLGPKGRAYVWDRID